MNSARYTSPFGSRQPQTPPGPGPGEVQMRRRHSYIYYPGNPPIIGPPPGFSPSYCHLRGTRPHNPTELFRQPTPPRPALLPRYPPLVEPGLHHYIAPPGFRPKETLFNFGLTPVQLYENYYRVYFINFHTFSGTFDNNERGFHPLSHDEFLCKYNRCLGVTPDADSEKPYVIGEMLESMMKIHDPTWVPQQPDSFTLSCTRLIYEAVVAHMDQMKQSVCSKYLAHRGRSGSGDGWPAVRRTNPGNPPGFDHPNLYSSPWSRNDPSEYDRLEFQSPFLPTATSSPRWAESQSRFEYLRHGRFGQPMDNDDVPYIQNAGLRSSRPEHVLAPMPTQEELLHRLRAVHRPPTDYIHDFPPLSAATSKPGSEAGYTSSNPDSVFLASSKVVTPAEISEAEEENNDDLEEYPELTVIPLKRKRVESVKPAKPRGPWKPPQNLEMRLKDETFGWAAEDDGEADCLYRDKASSEHNTGLKTRAKSMVVPIPFVNPFDEDTSPELSTAAPPNALLAESSSKETIPDGKDQDGLIEISEEEPDCWESRADVAEKDKWVLAELPDDYEPPKAEFEVQIEPSLTAPDFIDIQDDQVEFPPLDASPNVKKTLEPSTRLIINKSKTKKKRQQSPLKHLQASFKPYDTKAYEDSNAASIPSLLDLVLEGPERVKKPTSKPTSPIVEKHRVVQVNTWSTFSQASLREDEPRNDRTPGPSSVKKNPFVIVRPAPLSVDPVVDEIDINNMPNPEFKKPRIIVNKKLIEYKVYIPDNFFRPRANAQKSQTSISEAEFRSCLSSAEAEDQKSLSSHTLSIPDADWSGCEEPDNCTSLPETSNLEKSPGSGGDDPFGNVPSVRRRRDAENGKGEPFKYFSDSEDETRKNSEVNTPEPSKEAPVTVAKDKGKTSVWIRNINRGKGKHRTEKNQKKRARNRQARAERASGTQGGPDSDEDEEVIVTLTDLLKDGLVKSKDGTQSAEKAAGTTFITATPHPVLAQAMAEPESNYSGPRFAIQPKYAKQLFRLVHPNETTIMTKREKYTVKVDMQVRDSSDSREREATPTCAVCQEQVSAPNICVSESQGDGNEESTIATLPLGTRTTQAVSKLFRRTNTCKIKAGMEIEVEVVDRAPEAVPPVQVPVAEKKAPATALPAIRQIPTCRKSTAEGPRDIYLTVANEAPIVVTTVSSGLPIAEQCKSNTVYLIGSNNLRDRDGAKYQLTLLKGDLDRAVFDFMKYKKKHGEVRKTKSKDENDVMELVTYCSVNFPNHRMNLDSLHEFLCSIRQGIVLEIPNLSIDIRPLIRSLSTDSFFKLFVKSSFQPDGTPRASCKPTATNPREEPSTKEAGRKYIFGVRNIARHRSMVNLRTSGSWIPRRDRALSASAVDNTSRAPSGVHLMPDGRTMLTRAVSTSDLVYPSPAELMMSSEKPGPQSLRSLH